MKQVSLRIVDKLVPLIQKPKRIKIVVGGRGSGKSTGIGDIMLMFADSGERICCTREFQNSIDDSVHENLKVEIDRLGLEGFNVMASEIHSPSGGQLFYKGLARNITSLKSLANVNRLWIEEGESVSTKSLKVLTPSIRSSAAGNAEDGDPPEIWVSMNRGSSKDAISKKYLSRAESELSRCGYYEDDLMIAVEVNWTDNPWFPPELEQERQDDFENLSTAEYDHIWGGAYADTVENAIIKPEWFDACIDAHIKLGFEPMGQERVSYDPADTGDAKAVAHSHGSVVMDVRETQSGLIDTATDWATSYAIEKRPDTFTWDADGIGGGLKRQIETALRGKRINFQPFKGSEGADNAERLYGSDAGAIGNKKEGKTNKEMFTNKRAQYYWTLRDRMLRTYQAITDPSKKYASPDDLISFSSEIENIQALRAELCRIPRKFVASGRYQLMTKLEMKAMDIDSPNMADAVMMLCRELDVRNTARIAQGQRQTMAGWT